MPESLLLAAVLVLAAFLTGIFRGYALKKGILDIPGRRSSHQRPTPRGGGLAIVISYLLALLVLLCRQHLSLETFLALSGGGGIVAAAGALDDHRSLKAGLRLFIHFLAAAWGLYWLNGLPEISLGGYLLEPGWLANLCGIVLLGWFLNLFNFMDGIDGIAASEAVFISAAAVLIIRSQGGGDTLLLSLFACSCLGFLFWNWPPARIFMGDAGSGFLGIILGLLAVHTSSHSPGINIWTWLILAGFFIVDTTVTLLRRIIAGETWYRPHRSHCYQVLARRWQSHRRVTVLFLLVNIFWLLPLAFLSVWEPSRGHIIMITAWLPLVCGVYLAGAGKRNA
ncbi:MAG: glycosyltransferase family 4 protein [Desulfobia sp.]